MTRGILGARGTWLALAPALLVFIVAVILFGRAQNIWIDETTQLSGATLTPGPLIGWLTGALKIPFGVPGDRMPPVSYLVDMIGWRLWGDNVLAFRFYHAAIAGLGMAVLVLETGRRFGTRAALVAGLILALSPKLVETAVEIRAYPIFFALSCLQVALLLRGEVAVRTGRLALFLLLGLASGYTHFFGVVATSAFAAAIFIDAPDVKAAIRVVIGYALLLLLWSGLAPFIFGAASLSAASQVAGTGAGDIAAFLLQLLSNSAILVQPIVAIAYFAGALLLGALGAVGIVLVLMRRGVEARHDAAVGIAVALLAGLVVTLAAAFAVKGFNALSPRYNIWMLPPVAVLLAVAADGILAPAGRLWTAIRLGALALFAGGALFGQIGFLARADWFIHGPSRTLEAVVAKGGGPIAVVHVGSGWAWGYFPLYWRHRDSLPQWLLTPDGRNVIRIGQGGDTTGRPQPLSALADQERLLVSRVDLLGHAQLRAIGAGTAPPPVAELAPALKLEGWRSGLAVYRPGNYAFTGQLYQKHPSTPAGTDETE